MHSSEPEELTSILNLPEPPATELGEVKAWAEPVSMRTYAPEPADRNPMFLERRVYQGSSGRVYPLPFIDRISREPVDRQWEAIHLENEYLRVMILPEIGGRIHVGLDKRNGFDFFYRQNVIKPALVGLAGPWVSGGVEFNWPQHHRPATFMPVQWEIERHFDGSITVWCSDHDPLTRMKGMHGVCLHPDKAYIELKVRLFNRTPLVQTFLWWANAAVRVHEHYQSFFPPDARFAADHAKRAITSFPLSDRFYYGVDYLGRARTGVPMGERPSQFIPNGSYPPNDLRWYANIPVPTSYMIVGSDGDFFGGYDHAADAGLVHVASHQIAPGKKQWTWGNHEFGYAWDRNLTDADGPYIELMAGLFTDNQPDFSFLAPYETRSFRQFWYPIRRIGSPNAANVDAALSLRLESEIVHIGVCVTQSIADARLRLFSATTELAEWVRDLTVAEPLLVSCALPDGTDVGRLRIFLESGDEQILSFETESVQPATDPDVATEPPLPEDILSADELYITGLHLEQYRHATRPPQIYWSEALRRDPGDSRCNNALGIWLLRRGEFSQAESHLRAAIARLTHRNPNPYDGEPFYNLGLALRFQDRDAEAYDAFYKATWNAAWRGPAWYALAAIAARRTNWHEASEHLRLCLLTEGDNLNARNLRCIVLTNLGLDKKSEAWLQETSKLDPLDSWSRFLLTGNPPADHQQRLDLAFDLANAGLLKDAIAVLQSADPTPTDGSEPITLYTLAHFHAKLGMAEQAAELYRRAAGACPDYCFPARLDEMIILEAAVRANPGDGRAAYYLGNLYYDRRRHEEAICQWECAVRLDPDFPIAWRNLGIARFNVRRDAQGARGAFERAFAANPLDARVLYERDQLWKRTGELPESRLSELNCHPHLCDSRDDLALERATLLNQTAQPDQALHLLLNRKFQPWEGGEGLVLEQYTRSLLLLGERALAEGNPEGARKFFVHALHPPENLSEARHLLANQSNIWFWIGASYAVENQPDEALDAWKHAARVRSDFQQMSVRVISDMTFWSALAMQCLGERDQAQKLFQVVFDRSVQLEQEKPRIDYFATSLPAMLLFEADLGIQNKIEALFLRAQACLGLGRCADTESLLLQVLNLDKNHLPAAELQQQKAALVRLAEMKPSC